MTRSWGRSKRKNKDINPDPVILKGDGFPTYHLANVVDDHLMEITPYSQGPGVDSLRPAARAALQGLRLGAAACYCHLPMVMGKDGQKLSKRHGSTSVLEFRKEGYLPEALLNYVSLLGWSYDDSRESFSAERNSRSSSRWRSSTRLPGIFDYKKLAWFNGQYIRQMSDDALAGGADSLP